MKYIHIFINVRDFLNVIWFCDSIEIYSVKMPFSDKILIVASDKIIALIEYYRWIPSVKYHVTNAEFNLYLTSGFNLQKVFCKWHLRRTLVNWKVKWKNTVHNNSTYLTREINWSFAEKGYDISVIQSIMSMKLTFSAFY